MKMTPSEYSSLFAAKAQAENYLNTVGAEASRVLAEISPEMVRRSLEVDMAEICKLMIPANPFDADIQRYVRDSFQTPAISYGAVVPTASTPMLAPPQTNARETRITELEAQCAAKDRRIHSLEMQLRFGDYSLCADHDPESPIDN
jgi:hypothetical protein